MKKCLLGSLFILGTMAYAQPNKVITPIIDKNATANMQIEVSGRVFDPATASMVIDIKSAPSANGLGFAFQMPDLFKEVISTTSQGDFEVSIQQGGTKLPLTGTGAKLAIGLVKGGAEPTQELTGITPAGTAKGVELKYSLINGGGNTGNTELNGGNVHNAGIVVEAGISKANVATANAGTYSDASAQLRVALTNFEKTAPTELR